MRSNFLRTKVSIFSKFSRTFSNKPSEKYVPKHEKPAESEVRKLRDFLSDKPGILVGIHLLIG
jgi:hypothetical protein